MTTFEQLGLSKEIIKALKENGFESPFPIQQVAIPLILKGLDIIGQADTGTGKTRSVSNLQYHSSFFLTSSSSLLIRIII